MNPGPMTPSTSVTQPRWGYQGVAGARLTHGEGGPLCAGLHLLSGGAVEQQEARAPCVGEPCVLVCGLPSLLPPPGLPRPGFAHSAAGKCYFAGKVSAGTARIPAAAPGPLSLFFFASPAASRGVGRPAGRGLAPGSQLLRAEASVASTLPPLCVVRAGGSCGAGPIPLTSRPPRGPRLLVRPRAQSRAPSRRV